MCQGGGGEDVPAGPAALLRPLPGGQGRVPHQEARDTPGQHADAYADAVANAVTNANADADAESQSADNTRLFQTDPRSLSRSYNIDRYLASFCAVSGLSEKFASLLGALP